MQGNNVLQINECEKTKNKSPLLSVNDGGSAMKQND
jgi:hypothetical protein